MNRYALALLFGVLAAGEAFAQQPSESPSYTDPRLQQDYNPFGQPDPRLQQAYDPFAQTDPRLLQALEQLIRASQRPPATAGDRSISLGRTPPVQPPEPPAPELRVYDLADLFAISPAAGAYGWVGLDRVALLGPDAFDASAQSGGGGGMGGGTGGGMGGMGGMGGGMGGGGMFSVPDDRGENTTGAVGFTEFSAAAATPAGLIATIQSAVPGDWDTGEDVIEQLGSSLIVRAPVDSHRQIESLMNLLADRWKAKVDLRVTLDWIYLSDAELRRLNGVLAEDASSADRWDEFRSGLNMDGRPEGRRAVLSGFNGQPLAWVSGRQERVLSHVDHGEKGTVETEVAAPHYGLACEVLASLAHSSDLVTVNFRGRWLSPADLPAESSEASPAEASNSSDEMKPAKPARQSTEGQTLIGTARFPLGGTALLAAGSDARAADHVLCVIATVESTEEEVHEAHE